MSFSEVFFSKKIEKIDEIENFEKIGFLMILIVKIKETHQIKLLN